MGNDDKKEANVGGHHYPGAVRGSDFYMSDCAFGCGCWMGGSRSGGPDGVDPFGSCPKNDTGVHSIEPTPLEKAIRDTATPLTPVCRQCEGAVTDDPIIGDVCKCTPHANQAICCRCGGDLYVEGTDDPCKCDDPIPTQDNKLIKFLDDLTNDRDAYRTLLTQLVGRDVSEDVEYWKSGTEAEVDFSKEIEVPGRQFDASMRVLEVAGGHARFHDPASGIKWWMAQFGVSSANPGSLQNLDRAIYRPSSLPDKELAIKDRQGPTDWRDRPDECTCNIIPANDELVAAGAKGNLYTERYVQQLKDDYETELPGIVKLLGKFGEVTVVPLDLTTIDALYVSLRAVAAARWLKNKLGEPFEPSTFDVQFRNYLSYLLDHGAIHGLDMGWEDVDAGVYKVSIKPTPVAEVWDLRLHPQEPDIHKFATTRYWNMGQDTKEPYKPFSLALIFEAGRVPGTDAKENEGN